MVCHFFPPWSYSFFKVFIKLFAHHFSHREGWEQRRAKSGQLPPGSLEHPASVHHHRPGPGPGRRVSPHRGLLPRRGGDKPRGPPRAPSRPDLHWPSRFWVLPGQKYVMILFRAFYDSCHFLPRTTVINLGNAHCLALRAPTLDLWLEITKSRKFVIQVFIWIKKF